MTKKIWFIVFSTVVAIAFLSTPSFARDLGFRYNKGKCINEAGGEGLNPSFFGPCSDLTNTTISNINFEEMDFSGSKFSNSDLQRSNFRGAILVDVDFDGAVLTGVSFERAKLERVNFARVDLRDAKFMGASFADVGFEGANLAGQKFNLLSFQKCRFPGANLTGTDFSKASMAGVTLNDAVLLDSKFVAADLAGAALDGANMRGADLTTAKVAKATFNGSVYNKKTKLPFNDADAKKKMMVLKVMTEFSGIVNNLAMDGLDGWEVCYSASYGSNEPIAKALEACKAEYVMLACRDPGAGILTVAAYGKSDKVFKEIGQGNVGTLDNNVQFYFSDSYSIGFAPAGAKLDRNSCDVEDKKGGTGAQRLCWHTTDKNFQQGFRCGESLFTNAAERVILKSTD